MTPTKKLYELDSHKSRFEAKVISCTKIGETYEIILDETAFFPEGGGQSPDTGRIGDVFVTDVQIKDGVIKHYTNGPLTVGEIYQCEIDYEKRFRRMQNHSGEHIVSGIIHRELGLDNVGFHMGSEDVTIDVNGILSEKEIKRVEYLANLAVSENVRIFCEYPTREELEKIDYRSKLDLTEDVRLVTIEGYDSCACCAPHVKRTGEIGIIKLLDHYKNRDGTRIHMLCGFDALEDYDERYHMICQVAQSLSVKQNMLGEAYLRLENEIAELKQKNYELRTSLTEYKVAAIEKTDGNLCVFEADASPNDMRKLMNSCLSKCGGVCAVFSGSDEKGYNFVAASNSVKLRSVVSDMREKLLAKGGGNDEMIQGSVVASEKKIKEFFGV